QAEDGIRDKLVTGVQTCALPILTSARINGSPTGNTLPFNTLPLAADYRCIWWRIIAARKLHPVPVTLRRRRREACGGPTTLSKHFWRPFGCNRSPQPICLVERLR